MEEISVERAGELAMKVREIFEGETVYTMVRVLSALMVSQAAQAAPDFKAACEWLRSHIPDPADAVMMRQGQSIVDTPRPGKN